MNKYGVLAFVSGCALTASLNATPVQVSVTIDQWQSPLPYRWVQQTQSNSYFTAGKEYDGLVSGTVVANGVSQRYLFFCTQMNQNIYIGQTYTTFQMYSPDEYLQTPFRTGRPAGGGSVIEVQQKQYIQGVFKNLGINQISGFVDAGAQDLSGFPLTPETQLAVYGDKTSAHPGISNDQAALAQMSIWEMTHEVFDPAHPTASIDLHAGLIQWAWDGNVAFTQSDLTKFDQTVQKAESYVPEPGIVAFAAAMTTTLAVRRRAPQATRRKGC